jgi:hypothetical protein
MVQLHPISNAAIEGVILPPGTELLEGDVYASTRGNWESNPVPHARLRTSHVAWVRPSGDLNTISKSGKALLCYLAEHNFLVTEDSWHWKVIPEPRWKNDDRMDWGIKDPECIPELITRGLLLPHPHAWAVYELSDAGKEAAKMFGKQ